MKRFGSLMILFLVAALGCQSEEANNGKQPVTEADAIDPALKSALIIADKADGTEDKTVSKCIMCSLGMDGTTEFTVSAHGYEFHMCKTACKTYFAEDPDKALARVASK